jgi:hypothetical protein
MLFCASPLHRPNIKCLRTRFKGCIPNALYLLDHRLTASVNRAGRNLFLCYPDEMESIAIVCLENFTVSASGLICTVLCRAYCCAVQCTVLCSVLCCAVQCSMLFCKGAVDIVEAVVAVMLYPSRYFRNPIPSHLAPSPSPFPSISLCAVQGEYIVHVGELALTGTVGGVPQAPFGRYWYCRAVQERQRHAVRDNDCDSEGDIEVP